ncbi:hypothetical protein BJ875DRAFT_457473 [Amylocarpus encephaloides]|uniref:Heterokaryon incompatibility domain-containing protein n=1 Tax=Amylocarpus encephaloides TaxID=45428 RepID=A0A9P7YLZ5_9HELO|nr:hypothetical protein BJ875DRAFT_457473 [Amylocarpus encephaloides]
MSSIYGNSTITLAAAGADDGTYGLHIQRPNFMGRVTAPQENNNGLAQWEFGVEAFQRSVTEGPLAARAWALQESLLSPGTVHFSASYRVGREATSHDHPPYRRKRGLRRQESRIAHESDRQRTTEVSRWTVFLVGTILATGQRATISFI